jgi:hypothetical protein
MFPPDPQPNPTALIRTGGCTHSIGAVRMCACAKMSHCIRDGSGYVRKNVHNEED